MLPNVQNSIQIHIKFQTLNMVIDELPEHVARNAFLSSFTSKKVINANYRGTHNAKYHDRTKPTRRQNLPSYVMTNGYKYAQVRTHQPLRPFKHLHTSSLFKVQRECILFQNIIQKPLLQKSSMLLTSEHPRSPGYR